MLVHKNGLCRLGDYGYAPVSEEGGWLVFLVHEEFVQEVKERLDMQAIPWREDDN
tara:strand:+ start:964 stop:1128 length:165 start_codon:yes stop_codon:yes gene_type:complete